MPKPKWTQIGLLCAALVAGLGGISIQAQDRAARELVAQRSRNVQAIVARIDNDRQGAIAELLSSWEPYVDSTKYNLWEELGPIAAKAPSWQIYGAALAGDLNTMIRVLRGIKSAGHLVNAYSAPQPKVAIGFGLDGVTVVGDTTNSLVFTPIAPCRVVDTRGTGARTGLIPNNGTRSFDLTTAAFTAGQGGAAACVGLPAFSHLGWAVNITVTNSYVAAGGLKAWGFGAAEPNASIINFTPSSSGGIANGLSLTGCFGCADDITIRSFGDSSHVIIDVMGYYHEAVGTDLTVTRHAGASTAIPPGADTTVSGANCPAGTSLVGGEMDDGDVGSSLADFYASGAQWTAVVRGNNAGQNATVYTRCTDSPVIQ